MKNPALLILPGIVLAGSDMAPTIGVRAQGIDASLEQIATIDVGAYAGNGFSVGCGFDGSYLWVSNGAMMGGGACNCFLLFDEDGNYIATCNQNGGSDWGLRDPTCYGNYMYGSQSTAIEYYDIGTHEKVRSFIGPENPNRAPAWDGTCFYTGNSGTEIHRFTWNGVSGSTAAGRVWSTAATSVHALPGMNSTTACG